jgi:hypothetical protein
VCTYTHRQVLCPLLTISLSFYRNLTQRFSYAFIFFRVVSTASVYQHSCERISHEHCESRTTPLISKPIIGQDPKLVLSTSDLYLSLSKTHLHVIHSSLFLSF